MATVRSAAEAPAEFFRAGTNLCPTGFLSCQQFTIEAPIRLV